MFDRESAQRLEAASRAGVNVARCLQIADGTPHAARAADALWHHNEAQRHPLTSSMYWDELDQADRIACEVLWAAGHAGNIVA